MKASEKTTSGRRRLLYVAGGAIAAGLLVTIASGCSRHSAAAQSEEGAKGVFKVPVVTPTRETIIRYVRQPGYIKSYETTPIYTKIAGFVEEVDLGQGQMGLADIGDHVKKGQLLARLWVPEMVQELELKKARVVQAKADLVQAKESFNAAVAYVDTVNAQVKEAEAGVVRVEAEVKRWDAEYVRAQRLVADRIFDKQTKDEAQHQLEASSANLLQAKAKLLAMKASAIESVAKRDKARADIDAVDAKLKVTEADEREYQAWLDYRDIKAPYNGVITERNTHTGHFVQSNSEGSNSKSARPLFDMVRIDKMRVTIQVPEADAVLIKDGAPCTVSIQGLLDREIPAKVTRCSWSLDDHARTLWVEIHLPNPKEELRPGMYAYASIEAEVPNAMVVPLTAILDLGDAHYVCVVKDGKVERTAVKLGYRTEERLSDQEAGGGGTVMVQLLQKRMINPKSKRMEWVSLSGSEVIVAKDVGALLDGQEVLTEPLNHDAKAAVQPADAPEHASAQPEQKSSDLSAASPSARTRLPLDKAVSADYRAAGRNKGTWAQHLVAEY